MWTRVACVLVGLLAAPSHAADSWEALHAEYEEAVAERSRAWAAQMRTDPQKAPPPAPGKAFWPRFQALAETGEGGAVVWMLRNIGDAPSGAAPRPELLAQLFARVDAAMDEDWIADALQPLVAARADLDQEALIALLGALAVDDRPDDVRRQARLGLAETLLERDPALALRLRFDAFAEGSEHFDPAELTAEERDDLAERVADALAAADRAHFRDWFVETDDGYFGKPGAPPDPEETHRPVLEELATRGSPVASVWLLTNTYATDDPTRARLRTALDVVADAEDAGDHADRLGYYVDSLVNQLGLDYVEPRVGTLIEKADPEQQARLTYSLGVGICEAADGDEEQHGRGLAILRDLIERYPDSKEATDAAGKIFRFTKLNVGQDVPDFETVDVEGNTFRLSDYKGKVTVIDFWGFW